MTSKISLLACTAIATFAAPALAQTAATDQAETAQSATAENGDTHGSDQEIVVSGRYILPDKIDTATGLGLTVRETPQSVSIVTAQRILDQDLVTAADVLVNSVGVSVNEVDEIRNNFYARGFEINNFQYDGVPIAWTLAGGAGETSTDVSIYERVEIVRGATGLLTGAGDPSASVNFVRKHADGKDLTGYLRGSYGSWDTWRLTGDVGGALTSDGRLRVRAVGRYERGDNYIDLNDHKKFVLYGVVDFDVTDSTLLRAGISHQENDNDSPAWGGLPTFYDDGSVTNWRRSKATTSDWTYWDTQNQNIFATISQQIGDRWSITANYNRVKNSEQTAILYLYGVVNKATGTIASSNPYSDDGFSIQNSYDAKITGNISLFGRDHELVLGALRSIQNRKTYTLAAPFPDAYPSDVQFADMTGSTFPRPDFATTPFLAVEQKVKQTGYYGAFRLNLADSFKLIGGGRISTWRQKGVSYGVVANYGDKNVFIPYVGALFDVTPNHRLYASYTKIFQPQSALDRNFRQLDPLEGNAYEIGLKSAFMNERLQTSIALFRIQQDNLAVVDGDPIIPPGGGIPQQPYRAAKGTKSEGFEVEVNGSPVENWNINFGYTQFKAKDADGNAVATEQPRKLLKLFTTYTFPEMLHGLTIGGGVNYRSKAYSAGLNPVTAASFRFQQNSYALVSLMARLAVTEQVQVQANLENLFDKKYYSQTGFFEQYRYGAPRNFSITGTYRF
jgi:outer membrane receptor for ferric coprogen and ferric-rhodotorulic acid